MPGTTAIAGHRTTWLAPFRHIDALHRGESIVLEMPYARLLYRVIGSRVVLPTDVSVLDPVGYSRVILSACTPLFSASHRLIVFARLSRPHRWAQPPCAPQVRSGDEPLAKNPHAYHRCSKPVSVCLLPSCRSTTPGQPSLTWPIQVIFVPARSAAASARSARLRGTQTHSS